MRARVVRKGKCILPEVGNAKYGHPPGGRDY